MTLGRDRRRGLIDAKEDFELLPTLAGLELKRRQLTEELREVLIEYQQVELEIERRRIVIPWVDAKLTVTPAHRFEICLFIGRNTYLLSASSAAV